MGLILRLPERKYTHYLDILYKHMVYHLNDVWKCPTNQRHIQFNCITFYGDCSLNYNVVHSDIILVWIMLKLLRLPSLITLLHLIVLVIPFS